MYIDHKKQSRLLMVYVKDILYSQGIEIAKHD